MQVQVSKRRGRATESSADSPQSDQSETPQNITNHLEREPFSGLQAGNLAKFVAYHLHQFQMALSIYTEMAAGDLGVERSSVRLLLLVDANPGAPQGRLAKAMNLERSSIVPIIDRLEDDGYLERRAHPGDGRSKALWLTRKGSGMVCRIQTLAGAVESEQILSGFSAQERELLIELMRRATGNILEMIRKG